MGMKEFNKTFSRNSNKSNIIKDETIKKAKESLKLLKKKRGPQAIKKRENKNRYEQKIMIINVIYIFLFFIFIFLLLLLL